MFYTHISGKDYHNYIVDIYKKEIIVIPIIGIKFTKFKFVNSYTTYWLDYYDLRGRLKYIINEAMQETRYMLNEEELIQKMEKMTSKGDKS